MPFIMAVLALAAGGFFWMNRARNAAYFASDLADMAQDVMGAARRFGFRRRANMHPVECLDDAGIAIAALGIAYLELDGLPRAEQQEALQRSLQVNVGQSYEQAAEALTFGRWLVTQCGGPLPGIDRLSRRLWKLRGADSFPDLMAVIQDVSDSGGARPSARQKEALEGIARVFRIT